MSVDYQPSPQRAAHDAHVHPNARLGVSIFLVYLVFYLGFMGIAAFKYDAFGTIVFAGLNLAIVYGIGLIVSAIVLALVYMVLCKPDRE